MLARVSLSLLLCCLVACGGNVRAPVEERAARTPTSYTPSHEQPSSVYRVQRGDTLYSIAFRYGLDYRNMAAANRIAPPYTIYIGQRIQLRESVAQAPAAAPPRPTASTIPDAPPAAGIATAPAPAKPASPAQGQSPAVPPRQAPASKPVTGNSDAFVGSKVSVWRWPTSGRVTRGYSGSVHKGIDISGKRGDPIEAVAAGKVVYAGSGIVGFGELLIVKHNDVYLSAYGHNDRLLVSEGQTVSAGQKIAEKGSSGTDVVKLHFEIRKEGKPIDPQRLLPRR